VVSSDELREKRQPSNVRRMILLLLPALAFLALLAFGLRNVGSEADAGSSAPDFNLPKLEGNGTLSSEDLKGKPVVLNFWASWCAPCREEAPLLERAWRDYRRDGVVFVGVNLRDSRTDARRFVEEFDITYPIVRDENQKLANELGVYGLPETVFIDHEWRLLATIAGQSQDDQRQTVVLGAISEEQLRTNVEILIRRAETGN
jgi:cytochrome c biogenesis protein CcmG/thiol:disulfide interchange protein DsbE